VDVLHHIPVMGGGPRLVFVWGTLSARLERFNVTAPIIFVLAGVLLTHGPLAVLSITPVT
jgi:sodium/hydrogen antiporter